MAKYENTAGRLLGILQRAANDKQPQQPCKAVWARVFGTEDFPRITLCLAKCSIAIERIEDEIRRLKPERVTLYERDFPVIRGVLTPDNFTGQFAGHAQALTRGPLTTLEVCATDLPKDNEVSEDSLSSIRKSVDDLFAEVLAATDIDTELRDVLLRLLSQMRRSIDDFWIDGAEGIEAGLSYIVGYFFVHKELYERNRSSAWFEKFKAIVNNLLGLVSAARMSVKIGHEAKELIEEAGKLLE